MIKLYQFPSCWNVLNPSPFCMKIEIFLRLAQLNYTIVSIKNPAQAPKKKLPFIDDNGTLIGDSRLIIEYLTKRYNVQLDANLTAKQRAISTVVTGMLDEHLYWCIVYARWVDAQGWPLLAKDFFGSIPQPMRAVIMSLLKQRMRKQLYVQGMGRHNEQELYALGCDDIVAIAALLPQQGFFFAEQPHVLDASLYAFISNILYPPFENPLKTTAAEFPQLHTYCENMAKFIG